MVPDAKDLLMIEVTMGTSKQNTDWNRVKITNMFVISWITVFTQMELCKKCVTELNASVRIGLPASKHLLICSIVLMVIIMMFEGIIVSSNLFFI